MSAEDGHRSVGRYELFDRLAPSEMATVSLAKENQPDGSSRAVVVKRIVGPPGTPEETYAAVAEDAQTVTRIRNPNLVPTIDVLAEERELFFISEFVQGETFARLLKGARSKSIATPIKIVSAVVVGALRGLHGVHVEASNFVHRDMTPQNILVGADGVARVLELGVARARNALARRDGSITTVPPPSGQVKPTSGYKAPEQIRAEPVDARTDVFSMAIVLWEALTGSQLFKGVNEGQILLQVLSGKVSRPSRIARGVTPALDNIVMKGVTADPKGRFQTAEEFASALEQRVGIASAEEVAAWVESVAGETLKSRAALVAPLEHRIRAPSPPPPPPVPPASTPAEPDVPIEVDEPPAEAPVPPVAPAPPVAEAKPVETPRARPAAAPTSERPAPRARSGWIVPVVLIVVLAAAAVAVIATISKKPDAETQAPASAAPTPAASEPLPPKIEEPLPTPSESAPAPAPTASASATPDAGKPAAPVRRPQPTKKSTPPKSKRGGGATFRPGAI